MAIRKVRRQIGEGFSFGNSSSTKNNIIVQPKFYKIILSQHECIRLRIPEDFARRYCKNMLNPVYLEVPSGEIWEVEVQHSEGLICLAKGWQDFCDYYSISCGHFLMFGYNARSHFNVTIFDLSATEIEYPFSLRIFHCHETHHAPKSALSESDDSVDILERMPESQNLNEKIPDMVEHSVENLGHGQSSKRKRHEEDVASPSFTRDGQKSNEDCRIHKQQSKSVYDQNKTVMDKKSTIAYQKAKAFKSKNPFVISFMQPSYVSSPFNLSIASKFARKYFLENDGNLLLRVPGSGSWSVKCTMGTENAKVHSGWKAFVLENKLKVGDVCVFEVPKGSKLFVDVIIFRAAGSQSKVLKSDNSVPCSQPKVVHTKKLKHHTEGSYGLNSKIKEEHGEGTEIEHSVKILGHCPSGHGSKRKRPEGDAEDVAMPSFTREGQNCRIHKQQSKSVYDQNKTVMDKESTIAYQKAQAFKSKNPFIISFMQPSYVSTPFILSIASKFAKKYFLENDGNLLLRVPGSGFWSVKCTIATGNSKVRSGWKAFVLDNKLKVGDVCVFEVIKGAQLFVDVTIFRADGSTLMHNIVPGGSDSKCKVIKTDNSVPCSQLKVVHTKKLKHHTEGSYGLNSKIKEQHGEGTEIEHSVRILGHCPSGHGSKIKRSEGNAEDHAVEKLQEDVAMPSFTRNTKKSGGSCGMHKQQSKITYDQNKTVMDKKRAIAYQRAKAFKSKSPFIVSFMQPSYISTEYILKISSTFARKYFLENDGNLVLRVPGSGSWSVKCTIGTGQAKVHCGWKTFVLENKLKVGDVCVFEVIKGAQLFVDVTIFRAAGSIPMHNIVAEVPGGSDSKSKVIKIDNSVPCSQPKVVQTKKLRHQTGGSYGLNSKIKEENVEGTEIENSVKILRHCPSGQGRKRKRPEGKAEDDVSTDIHTKSIKVEKSQEDVASPSFTRKLKKSGESCRMNKQQTEMIYAKKMTVLDKERTIAYHRAKAFKSKNPFVIYLMQPSYVSRPYNLHISFLFAWKYFQEKCGDLVLRVPGRGSWSVKYDLGISPARISFAWKAFVLDNKLKIGDVCVFELIKSNRPFLDVTIFRAAERKPMHKIDGQVSDIKNKIIKTENSVPCSQPKIVHSHLEMKQKGDSDGFITSKIKEELSEGTGRHVQHSKSSSMGRVVDKEMVMAYQKAKTFTSKYPFFIRFMQPSYVSGPMQLTITPSVARKFFSTRHSDVVLQVASKRRWAVKCTLGISNAKFSTGWKEFVLDNNLKVGDVCVFEYAGRSKLLFNVIIFPCAEGI